MRPPRRQPTRLSRPWDSPCKNTGVGCHFLLRCKIVKSESEVTQSCPTLATPWTAAYQAPPSMEFSRQKYWSGVPLPSPFIILGPGRKESDTTEQLIWSDLAGWLALANKMWVEKCKQLLAGKIFCLLLERALCRRHLFVLSLTLNQAPLCSIFLWLKHTFQIF